MKIGIGVLMLGMGGVSGAERALKDHQRREVTKQLDESLDRFHSAISELEQTLREREQGDTLQEIQREASSERMMRRINEEGGSL